MSMNTQQEHLVLACQHFGLEVYLDFEITLSSGRRIVAPTFIPSLGGPKGQLVFPPPFDRKGDDSLREIVADGYGYSIYGIPPDGEPFDLEGYRELFIDWGMNPGCVQGYEAKRTP